jgi:putative transposase
MDWGVVHFVTLSNGEIVDPCQPLKKFLPKLAKLQRRMARKKKFSKNWRKAKARVTKWHTKIANIRKDFVHKVSNDISKNHVVVVAEELQVKNISKSATKKVAQKSGLNRSILDASPFELRRQLDTKHSGEVVCWSLWHHRTQAASALSVGTYRQRIASRKQSLFASSADSQPMRTGLLP